MACGLPIVTTDLPGVRDYVNDDCCILTPKYDAQALADTVIALQKDSAKLKTMSLAGRKRAKRFSWNRIADELNELFVLLLNQ